jgi:hypothetical protein
MYTQATTWGVRPSSLSNIDDEWAAYQFDAAVLGFGREIETRISDGKRTADAVLSDIEAGRLSNPESGSRGADMPPPPRRSGFSSMKGLVTRKVKSIEEWIAGRE